MCDSYIVKREKRLIENAKNEGRAELAQKLADAKKRVEKANEKKDNAIKESREIKTILKVITDNLDEEGNVKLDKNTIQKILAITSKI